MVRRKKRTTSSGNSASATTGLAFYDFSKGLYLLDTPRTIGEQMASLAMVGGRNIWSEKGALVNQHGYLLRGKIPDTEEVVAWTKVVDGVNSFFIVTLSGKVYLYTASEGLKEYKTTFQGITDPILTRRGTDMIIHTDGNTYLFGSYYSESDFISIIDNVTIQDFTTYYEFTVPIAQKPFFWNGKDLCINENHHFEVLLTRESTNGENLTVRVRIVDEAPVSFPDPVNIGEKTLYGITLIFEPENVEPTVPTEPTGSTDPSEPEPSEPTEPTEPTEAITPQLFEVCDNRLFVVDVSGYVYYSVVGVMDNFSEIQGAGKFGGFYNDSSKFLAIEKYANGGIIVKQDGIYYFTLSNTSLNITRVFVGGQEYASDHVIVGDKIYAYDTNTGAIVNAIQVNVFGTAVSGKPVISSEFLNAENMGINATERYLTYNAESGVFILYYGESLNQGIVLVQSEGTLFPRQLDKTILGFVGFNQGVVFITNDGEIIQDFKKGSIVPNLTPYVDFEPIALRGNQLTCCSILEITELNGLEYNLATTNAGQSYQQVTPSFLLDNHGDILPPLLYSNEDKLYPSFAEETKWAQKKSQISRVYAPMSGREGVSISIEFPANTDFCLTELALPDFSQGE